MPGHRLRRLIQGQGGSTLIELLVAMPLSVLLLGIVIQALGVAGRREQDLERRTETVQQAELGLERMTREIRSASWVYFSSSSVVDIDTLVRTDPTATSVHRHVRYDCSGSACIRYEGAPVSYPPLAGSSFDRSRTIIGALVGDCAICGDQTRSRVGFLIAHDIFLPQRIGASGQPVTDFVNPNVLQIRVRLRLPQRTETVEVRDGVSLRNQSDFAS